jgi:hypothetical protein
MFAGVTAAWQRGDETYLELEFPDAADSRVRLHPAALDAALRCVQPELVAVTTWQGVTLAGGAANGALRVRFSHMGAGRYAVVVADSTGATVATVDTAATTPLPPAALRRPDRDASVLALEWIPVAASAHAGPARAEVSHWAVPATHPTVATQLREAGYTVVEYADAAMVFTDDAPLPDVLLVAVPTAQLPFDQAVRAQVRQVLSLRRLDEFEGLAQLRLGVLTESAVAVTSGDQMTDVATAAAIGLVRVAATESPARITVIDYDGAAASAQALPAAIASEEPQLALRDGTAYAPRLRRAPVATADPQFQPTGTVLVTGADSELGMLAIRYAAQVWAAPRLLVVHAPGRPPFAAELPGQVEHVTCDLADRAALAELLAAIPAAYPLAAVVHVARPQLAPTTVAELSADEIAEQSAAGLAAAWLLHELTESGAVQRFVVFAGVDGLLGTAGAARSAPADAGLLALAAYRRSRGLPATAVLWSEAGLFEPRAADNALALLDAALRGGRTVVLADRPDELALRALAEDGTVPALLWELARPHPRPTANVRARLIGRSDEDAHAILLAEVRRAAAVALGHAGADAIAPDRNFADLGFESLTGVRLRNALAVTVGTPLPATLVYDCPTPLAVADYLLAALRTPAVATPAGLDPMVELERLEAALSGASDDVVDRAAVAARLRTMLAHWSAPVPDPDVATGAALVLEADVDELLELIDAEVGGIAPQPEAR